MRTSFPSATAAAAAAAAVDTATTGAALAAVGHVGSRLCAHLLQRKWCRSGTTPTAAPWEDGGDARNR